MFTRSLAQRLQTPLLSNLLKLFFVLLIAAEIYASLAPVDDTGIDFPHADKLVHFMMHWVNMCLAGIAFIKARSFLVVGIALFFLGPLIELMHDLVPYRDASLADQLANTLGFLAGLLTARYLLRSE